MKLLYVMDETDPTNPVIADKSDLYKRVFTDAREPVTVSAVPHWLREFFEIDSGPDNLLDPSNPNRELVLGSSDGAVFEAGFSGSGPSLDLG